MRGRWSLGERTESKAAVSSHSRRLHEEEQNNASETLDQSSMTHSDPGHILEEFKQILQELILLFKQKAITHPDLLVYQLSGHFHLLRRSADGEDPDVGVGVWRRISLQLHMSAGLLVDVLYGLST